MVKYCFNIRVKTNKNYPSNMYINMCFYLITVSDHLEISHLI